jgi:hypothetical protein
MHVKLSDFGKALRDDLGEERRRDRLSRGEVRWSGTRDAHRIGVVDTNTRSRHTIVTPGF